MNCRHCKKNLEHTFLDLGFAPPSNAYLAREDLTKPEKYFPLRVKVCTSCWLVQTEDYTQADDLFRDDYAYFSSTSSGWLNHAATYAKNVIDRFKLDNASFVIEIASNDGYLLKNFVNAGIPCLGVEPTASTAAAAEKLGVPVLQRFFGEALAVELVSQKQQADLIVGNNVYAHVPDINDFTRGLKVALKDGGTITLEFPHLIQLLACVQFDTVYHEHFSYLSLTAVINIFRSADLRIWDVEELATHGGSIRVYGCHQKDPRITRNSVTQMLNKEAECGLKSVDTYKNFQVLADNIKYNLVEFLIQQKRAGKRVAAYGAAAKGNTLLNYAGVKPDLLPFICDASESKQGKYMPGSHIPILHPSTLEDYRPDLLLVLPWNIVSEIKMQNWKLEAMGTKFCTAVPSITLL